MVSLFKNRAPEPAPTANHAQIKETIWTRPDTVEGLKLEIAKLQAIIETSLDMADRREAEVKLNYCQDALTLKTQACFAQTEATVKPCGRSTYNELCEKAAKIGLEPEWVSMEIERQGGTPDNFRPYTAGLIMQDILQLTAASAEVQREKKREARAVKAALLWEWPGPVPGPGMKAKRKPNGAYVHSVTQDVSKERNELTDLEFTAYEESLKGWCKDMGLPPETVNEQWHNLHTAGKLEVLKDQLEGHSNLASLTNLRLLQARIALLAKQTLGKEAKDKMGLFDAKKGSATTALTEAAAATTTAEKPKFSFAKPASTTAAAAPAPTTAADVGYKYSEEDWAAIRQELGIKDGFVIDTKEKADWALSKMKSLGLDLAYLIARYNEEKPRLERAYEACQERFKPMLKAYADANKPADGKKTINLLWGSIGWQNKAESVALDPRDTDELVLQGWIHTQSQEFKDMIGAKPVPRYTRNLDALKAWALAQKKNGADMPPGLDYKPAQEDVFFVRPSVETLREDIKKGKLK